MAEGDVTLRHKCPNNWGYHSVLTGRDYFFTSVYSGNGLVQVDPRDVDYLLSVRRSKCCGRPSIIAFERVE